MVSLMKEVVSVLRDHPQSLKGPLLHSLQQILRYSILFLFMFLMMSFYSFYMRKIDRYMHNCRMLIVMKRMMMMLTFLERRRKGKRRQLKSEQFLSRHLQRRKNVSLVIYLRWYVLDSN